MCIIISLVFELVPCWRQKQLMSPPKAAPPSPVRPERLHHGSGSDNRLAPPWRTPGERNHWVDWAVTNDLLPQAPYQPWSRVCVCDWRRQVQRLMCCNPLNICCSPMMHFSLYKDKDFTGSGDVSNAVTIPRTMRTQTQIISPCTKAEMSTVCVCVRACVCERK